MTSFQDLKVLIFSQSLGKLVAITMIMFIVAESNYLLFHTLAEGFAIVVSALIYVLATRTSKYLVNYFLFFLGTAYFFIGILDFFHVITYKGTGIFTGYGADTPTQLWIVGRYMEAFSLFLAPYFIGRKFSRSMVFWIYAIITFLLMASILWFKVFPVCFVEGQGLTAYKIVSEYVVSLVILGAIIQLYWKQKQINYQLYLIMTAAMIVTILSEMSFTFYADLYGIMNFIGHILKVASYYLIYRGIVLYGIEYPYAELNDTNAKLKQEIVERKQIEGSLRSLAAELSIVEERERRRIATDIHDYVGQSLAVAKIKLQYMGQTLSSTVDNEKMEEIRMHIDEAIKYSRSLMLELSPPVLYEFGLGAALEWMCEHFSERYGIQFTFEDDDQPKPVDDEVRVILFKAVREMLINNVKHSKAKLVKVSLQKHGEKIRVFVKDDGIGFESSRLNLNKDSGFGFFSVRERLLFLGGNMYVESKPGRGSCITMEAPLSTDEMLEGGK